ncbi:MAG TPA: protein phosphatase 2C domain-containing protein [Gemmatimonadales bacterium]
MTTPKDPNPERKPRDDEIDVFGMTHPGKVRPNNQDHFLICSLSRAVTVHATSLPEPGLIAGNGERVAFLSMVADGVGGGPSGEEASRIAVENIAKYITHSLQAYHTADPTDHAAFRAALEAAAWRGHEELKKLAEDDPDRRGMATTLTLWLGIWPQSYLLQVGDSRCYLLKGTTLTQVSRDQTMAQELFDQGVLTTTEAHRTPLANVLSSSIGGSQTAPVVTPILQEWGNVGMLCSDGLYKHVSDDQIKQRLTTMTSAKQVCEALLQDALDGGGTDNVTIVVGRTVRK